MFKWKSRQFESLFFFFLSFSFQIEFVFQEYCNNNYVQFFIHILKDICVYFGDSLKRAYSNVLVKI